MVFVFVFTDFRMARPQEDDPDIPILSPSGRCCVRGRTGFIV
jgi:hypothetical protein